MNTPTILNNLTFNGTYAKTLIVSDIIFPQFFSYRFMFYVTYTAKGYYEIWIVAGVVNAGSVNESNPKYLPIYYNDASG